MTESATRPPLSHRDAMLRQGLKSLFAHGFNGMTVDGVLEATRTPKGSFYHHFGTKEGFTAAVLERYRGFHYELLEAWAGRADLTTVDQVTGYYLELTERFAQSGFHYGDFSSKLATEVSMTSEPLRRQIAVFIRDRRLHLERVLLAGQERGDIRQDRTPHDLSAAIDALIRGTFVVGMTRRGATPFPQVARAIEYLLSP